MEASQAVVRSLLKSGKTLAITPDLLARPEEGLAVRIFGRPASLPGGAFVLAHLARAPIIRCHCVWQSDVRVTLMFERAPPAIDADNRDAAVRAAAQDWCCWFEDKVRANPENWLFWLDRRWSRWLRAVPRTSA